MNIIERRKRKVKNEKRERGSLQVFIVEIYNINTRKEKRKVI